MIEFLATLFTFGYFIVGIGHIHPDTLMYHVIDIKEILQRQFPLPHQEPKSLPQADFVSPER